MALPLDGIRVVDLTQVMAGPFCTLLLADLGADVIKVEPPGKGDLSRSMGGEELRMKGRDNAPFLALNRNKRSVVLDLKDEADLRAFRALVRSSDVLVENFRPGVTERLGIDYETLAASDPGLVYASISGFGQTGPYAGRPGFDLIAQAMSGILSVTGTPGGEPVKCGVPISDLAAGLYGAVGVLAALASRDRSGGGQHVETSLFEAALGLSVWETTEYWATGEAPRAWGSAHRLNAPYQAFRTGDGSIVLAALTPGQWAGLCGALDRPELTDDPRFATNQARMANLPELVREIETALSEGSAEAWVERFLTAGVPAAPLLDYAQVFADPHTRARKMVEEVEHPVEGTIRTLGFPLKMGATPLRVRRPPPLLGEHTDEVLGELGRS
ncbi:MAG: CoA transferase [Gemmatimonadota bacterium]|jgi:formyl-CoA transferase